MTPKRIGLVSGAEFFHFNLAMAKEVKRRTGCEIVLYVNSAESVRKQQKYVEQGYFDDIADWDAFYRAVKEDIGDEESVFARARTMEAFVDCTYNELMMMRRDVGHGFALAGFYHPRSPSADALDYPHVVHGMTAALEFWRNEIESRNLDAIINGPKDAGVVARAMGVPYRFMYSTRFRNYHYWARDPAVEFPGLEGVYRALGDRRREPVTLEQEYYAEIKSRAKAVGGDHLLRLIQRLIMHVNRRLYVLLKGYKSEKSYYFKDIVAFYLRHYRTIKKLRPPFTTPLSQLKGQKFVFLPLQTDPEMSLQALSPEYFSLHAMIASVARDLPAGVILAVKETVHALGRRPHDFYDQIRDFKNVVFIDVMDRGVEIVRHAEAVVTIASTSGLEAAMIGKPVILFGRHNVYQFVPHVQLVTREEDLRPALKRALDGSIDRARAQQDGARLRDALVDISFDLRGFNVFEPGSVDAAGVRDAVESLLASLDEARENSRATA